MHSLVAHGDAIGDRDGAELHGESPTVKNTLLGSLSQPVETEVARRDLVPTAGDPHLRLEEVRIAHSHRAQHATRSSALKAIGYFAATGFDVRCFSHAQILLGGGLATPPHYVGQIAQPKAQGQGNHQQ